MQFILISSGRGPLECELAVGLYLAFFLKRHPNVRVRKEQKSDTITVAGKRLTAYKSALLEVPDAQNVNTGAVKWICQSPVRPGHQRKNWFIDVSRVSDAELPPEIDKTGLDFCGLDKSLIHVETFRCPGKGGQNVNKVETGVRIKHLPTGLTAQSVTARTQLANKKLALQRLKAMIEEFNAKREDNLSKIEWQTHDRLERGNEFAIFTGLDFAPSGNG